MFDEPLGTLSQHACSTTYGDLSGATVRAAQNALVDTVGAGVAGTSAPMSRMVVQMASESGGRPESALWGTTIRVPMAEAAFANAVTGRCLELDDVHEGSPCLELGFGGHVSIMVAASVLAAAEASPLPVSGQELITAIAVGSDLVPRVRMAAGRAGRFGWEGPSISPFGVAAAVGRLWNFDEATMGNALSAAYAQCSGNVQGTTDGSWDVWLNAGLGARGGLVAANLARHGHQGTSEPFLGQSGLYNLYFRGEYHPEALIGDLGSRWENENLSVKIYSSCRYTHNAIYAVTELMRENNLRPDDVASIWVGTSTSSMKMVGVDSAGKLKSRPASVAAAQFSLPFTIALGIVDGRVFPDNLTQDRLSDPALLSLADRVTMQVVEEKDSLNALRGYPPDDIRITTADGVVISACLPHTKGHPANPLTPSELADKFDSCCELAQRPPTTPAREQFLEAVHFLPTIDDARTLVTELLGTTPH